MQKVDDNYKYKRLIIPETSRVKQGWDMYCMCLVLYVSLVIPYRLGLDLPDTRPITIVGYVMDLSFLLDMCLSFCSESYDPKAHKMINTHKSIAIAYIKGWFWVDLISIIPFELIFKIFSNENANSAESLGNFNQSIRITRITKIYKMVRFLRLAKIAKALKTKSNFRMKQNLKVQDAFSRMGYFFAGLVLMIHLLACLWCAFYLFDEHNWMVGKI